MTPEECDRETKELRALYYSMRVELHVLERDLELSKKAMTDAMEALKKSQNDTNKILLGIAISVIMLTVTAVFNGFLSSRLGG